MDIDMAGGLSAILLLVILHSFFSFARSAVINLRRVDLRHRVEGGEERAKLLEHLTEDSTRLLATFQAWTALTSALAVAVAALTLSPSLQSTIAGLAFLEPISGLLAVFIVIAGVTLVLIVAGDLVPEAVASTRSDSWAFAVARPVAALTLVTRPVVSLVVWLSNLLSALLGGGRLRGMTFVTEEEIMTMVDAGQEEGVIQEDEKQMIFSIFALDDTLAREVMVPRIDLIALDVETPLNEALQVAIEAGHSRIPVYEDNIDNIVGLLYAKDLLLVWRDGHLSVPLRELLRRAYFVPESKKVTELLSEMQQRKVHMSVVVDEYGGTAGVVTIEDIVEEIVGEIQDEYDSEEPSVVMISHDEYIFDARVDTDDVNRLIDSNLPTELGDTLGGFIYSQLGKVPAVGDRVEFQDLGIEVLTVSGRRIRKVRVARQSTQEPNGDGVSESSEAD